ncbi:MAG: hypothetical protein PHY66_08220 [Aliarcobacter sp.]|nr:hypothetical protein [Aliarcobacter sp.]MDD2887775.1 hypothetical protein [Aliarcobacter sp.]
MTINEEKELEFLTKKPIDDQKVLLKHFAKLNSSQQKKVLNRQRDTFHKLKSLNNRDVDKDTLTLASLIISIDDFINSLSSTKLKVIKFKNKKPQVKLKTQKLLSYWSIVKELKENEKMSFRDISDYLQRNHKFGVSYSLIFKIWVEIEEREVM